MIKQSEKSILPFHKKLMFFTGGLTWFLPSLFGVLFFNNLTQQGIPFYVVLPCLVFIIAVVVFLFPLIYNAINRSTLIVMGRYHLPLIVSTLVASLATVFCFTTRVNTAINAIISLGCFAAFLVSFLTFEHIFLNLGLRLLSYDKFDKMNKYSMILGMAGFVIALACLKDANYLQALGYAGGIVMLIAGALVYFATVSSMPRFISLETPEKLGFKKFFESFFSVLSRKDFRLKAICLTSLTTGVMSLAFVIMSSLIKTDFNLFTLFLLVFALSLSSLSIGLSIKPLAAKSSFVALATLLCFAPIIAALYIIMTFVEFNLVLTTAIIAVSAIALGGSLSLLMFSISDFFYQAETEGLASLSRSNGNKNLLYSLSFLCSLLVLAMGSGFSLVSNQVSAIVVFSFIIACMALAIVLFYTLSFRLQKVRAAQNNTEKGSSENV